MITFPWRQRWSSSSKAKIGQLGKCRRGLKPSEETKEAKDVIQGLQIGINCRRNTNATCYSTAVCVVIITEL